MGNAGQIARGWVDAWRGWRDNPLAKYWNHAEQRRLSVLRWDKRSPGLLGLAIALSLCITVWLILLILRVLQDRAAGISAFHTDLALIGGTTALIMGVEVFAFCWLLARWFTIAQLALGFLALEPQPRIRQMLDDLLAVSALREQEILAGTGLYCLRLILPPLLLLNAARMAAGLLNGATAASGIAALGQALPAFLATTLGGCLAALALMLLMISVSLVPRAGIMPTVGAAMQVLLQLALPVIVSAAAAGFNVISMQGSADYSAILPPAIVYSILWLLVCGLLLYLARRLDWLRGAIAYALPLLLASIGLLIYAVFAMSGELFEFYGEIFLYGAWAAQFLALTAPITAASSHFDVLIPAGAAAGLQDWRMYLLVLAAQLVLLITCAEFARDALRRRKWGKEG